MNKIANLYQQNFTGNTEQLAAIRAFVTRAAADLGAGEEDVFACKLVTDEAASNAFQHAYAGQEGTVRIKVWREENEIVIQLQSWGAPFDPDEIPAPNLTDNLAERRVGGLGIFLMRKMVDDVSFQFDPVEGNRITMKRKLGQDRDQGER